MSVNGEKITSVSTPFDWSPVLAGGICVALDKYVLGEEDLMRSATLGVGATAGIYAGRMIAPSIPMVLTLPNSTLYNGKTLEQRIVEVGAGGLLGWGANTYILKNGKFNDISKKVTVIAVSDVLATYAWDYMTSKPLSYLG